MGSCRLTATLVARGPAAAIVLDDEQVAAVGEGARRFPVAATVNGYTWRTTVTRMRGKFLLGAPREVEVSDALATALACDPAAGAAFEALAYSHRKEYARWIEEAKRDETRRRRVGQALELLREGKTRG